MLWFLGGSHAFAGPPPGTPIDNVANATAVDPVAGPISAASNAVRAVVQPVERVTLDGPRVVSVAAGASGAFAHRVVNLGNVTSDVRLDVQNLAGDDFDLATLALFEDVDADGRRGPSDLPLAIGGVVPIAAGAALDLVVTFDVPPATPDLAAAALRVAGTTQLDGVVAAVVDSARALAPIGPPSLAFYRDAGFRTVTAVSPAGRSLYLQAVAPGANLSPTQRDRVTFTLTAEETGDVEYYLANETAVSSGVFRIAPTVSTVFARRGLSSHLTGILETHENDKVTATLSGYGATVTQATVWIAPHGTVFDPLTNAPVAGARIALVDVAGTGNGGQPGGPARVFDADGVTPAPSELVTGADGRYLFAVVPASIYRLDVVPPSPYRYPSHVPLASLPPGRNPDPSASYAGAFVVADTSGPVRFDLPVDAVSAVALFAEKTAGRTYAEIGDQIDYTVRVANRSDSTLADVRVADTLPPGFAYVRGTARRDGDPVSDPDGGGGPTLSFATGALAGNVTLTLTYRVRVGPTTLLGEAVNRAIASGGGATSNTASARVTVIGGAFAEEASIVGAVFADRDGDGRRTGGEPGIPGVRLYLDDGTFVITDVDGQYSLYGLTPRTHALKLDPTTLPKVTRLVPRRKGDDALSVQFVDVDRGGIQRIDFAAFGDTATILAIAQRRERAVRVADEMTRALRRPLTTSEDPGVPGDPRGRPTSGIVGDEGTLPLYKDGLRPDTPSNAPSAPPATAPEGGATPVAPRDDGVRIGAAPEGAAALQGAAVPEGRAVPDDGARDAGGDASAALEGAAPAPATPPPANGTEPPIATSFGAEIGLGAPVLLFIGLADGDTLASTQVTVRVQGPIGSVLELRVNGLLVPASRVGMRVSMPEQGIEMWDYVGVTLRPGPNRLEARELATGGGSPNVAITLVAPDRLGHLDLAASTAAPADGHSEVVVHVRARDARGVTVPQRIIVTLDVTRGEWLEPDLDPTRPGLQVALAGGEVQAHLIAPVEPGTAIVRASAEGMASELPVEFFPELRSLLVSGYLEGMVSYNYRSHGFRTPDRTQGGFQQDFSSFFSDSKDGTATAGARAALFARGRVRDDVLVTLGYDSDRPAQLRRFRDIQPDAFYPMFGDASVRGFEAQSTGRLFARVDRRDTWLLYGDFITASQTSTRSLTAYHRSFTGVQEHYENRHVQVDAFTSRTRSKDTVEELPGRGLSGPYDLAHQSIVENSEIVELIVRDRNQASVIIKTTPLARFTDYEMDPWAGRLLFREPVPALDADLNPVSIRIHYELRDGGDPVWASGATARVRVAKALEIGGTYVDDHDGERPLELRGVTAGAQLARNMTLEAEYARTTVPGQSSGGGGRIEIRQDTPNSQGYLFGAVTDDGFTNPSAGFSPGRVEGGLRINTRVAMRTRLLADGLYTGVQHGEDRRGGLLVAVDQGLTSTVHGELGLRGAVGSARPGLETPNTLALRTKLTAQVPSRPNLGGYLEYEQDLLATDRRLAAVGGEYRLNTRGRLYARHEFVSSLEGPWTLNDTQRRLSTVFGVDAEVARETRVFSEYRLADALTTREAETAVGLRNGWRLANGYRASTSFERLQTLSGPSAGPATSVTGSLESPPDLDVRASGRLEVRSSRASDSYLMSLAAASRLDPAWSLLGRQLASVTMDHARGTTVRDRLQIGLAYRPARAETWDALARYDLHLDRDASSPEAHVQRAAQVVSLHATGRMFSFSELSLAWAGKRARDESSGLATSSLAQWVHGSWTRPLADHWDVGLHSSALIGETAASRRQGLGIELGRDVGRGVWLSAGWNRFGYDDPDLPDEAYTREGVYLRIRSKFDESLVSRSAAGRP
jgi:uncharacterized repeat protein (TIGR01451 family)